MIAIGLHFYHKMQTDCWCARQDLNLHARAMEPKGDVTLVKGLKLLDSWSFQMRCLTYTGE